MSTFEKPPEKDNSATIHVRNQTILATELYKTKKKKSSCSDNAWNFWTEEYPMQP